MFTQGDIWVPDPCVLLVPCPDNYKLYRFIYYFSYQFDGRIATLEI